MVISKFQKIIAVAVAALVLLGGIAYFSFGGSDGSDTVDLVNFDYDEAYVDMQNLTGIGPRVPGTANDLLGAEYVEKRFTEAGLANVHIEAHEVTTFEVNSASLSLIIYGLRNRETNYVHIRDFVLYQYSGSSNGEITLDVVDVGDGSEESFEGLDVNGKAVITTQQALPRAAEHGARAVIVQNSRTGKSMGYPPYSGGLYGSDENGDSIPYPDANPNAVVPTCAVSKKVGDEIKDAISNARTIPILGTSTVRIQLNFDTTIAKNNIYNVVGDVTGTDKNSGIIYAIAHRDTTYINPGAADNTVGTVTIMEMARQMAKYELRSTMRFISADAEEKGLLGAFEYVKAHEGEVMGEGIICMNFDMNDVNLARVDTLEVSISNVDYRNKLSDIKDRMFAKYPELARRYKVNVTVGGGGPDAAPFMKRGIDGSFAMGEWGSSVEYHTQWDTIEHVNKESWLLSGVMFGTLALEIGR